MANPSENTIEDLADRLLDSVYSDMVNSLTKSPIAIMQSINPERANLWHMATGIATEAGELLTDVKSHVIYGKPLNRENMLKELGDLEFYMEGLRQQLSVSRQEILCINMDKLEKRQPTGKYTDADAIARADEA